MPDARRTVKWFTTKDIDQALLDAATDNFTLSTGLAAANKKGATVTRLIVDLNARTDTLGSIKHLYWGIVLIADGFTTATLPDPEVEGDRADWMVRGVMHTGAPALGTEFGAAAQINLDIRSQRRIPTEDFSLQLIISDSGAGAGGLLFTHLTRTLVRLP